MNVKMWFIIYAVLCEVVYDQRFYQRAQIAEFACIMLTSIHYVRPLCIVTYDKGGGKCFCPFVCLSVSKITQKLRYSEVTQKRVHGCG